MSKKNINCFGDVERLFFPYRPIMQPYYSIAVIIIDFIYTRSYISLNEILGSST